MQAEEKEQRIVLMASICYFSTCSFNAEYFEVQYHVDEIKKSWLQWNDSNMCKYKWIKHVVDSQKRNYACISHVQCRDIHAMQ